MTAADDRATGPPPEGTPSRRYELGSGLFLLLFGLGALVEARRLPLGDVGRPRPGFFPLYVSAALCVASVALVVRAWRARPDGRGAGPPAPPKRVEWWKALSATLALLAYAFVLEPLGFLPATALLMLFLFRAIRPQAWGVAVGGAAAATLGAYLLFKVWLGLRLPAGLLPW